MTELEHYIFYYCPELLTKEEHLAHRNLLGLLKIDSTYNEIKKDVLRRNLISRDRKVLELLENGTEEFYRKAVERVLRSYPKGEFLNLCPKCSALARTPKAKQCPKCFHSWDSDAIN